LTVECKGETNTVSLSTVARDDGKRLTVRWKVDGETKREREVAPGAVAFDYDFPHGPSYVLVEVTDGEFTASAGTTITVSDTTAPTLVVAADIVVPTDAGQAFATNVLPTPPEVFDACDGDPTLQNDAPLLFPVGETLVAWTAVDADGNQATATQRVTVEDREPPRLDASPNVRTYCDPGEVFATAALTPPGADDNVTQAPVVTNDASSRFRIGSTRVTWTATDEAGNSATNSMVVTVVNRKPKANAGSRIVAQAKTERGVRVRLDGSRSSDPDGQALKYFWRAPGVLFADARSAKPIGLFPIGSTTATLTVTDEAGVKKSARVRVVVRLANSADRHRGAQANRAFDAASRSAYEAATSGSAGEARLSALAHAAVAQRLGVQAGERVCWIEGGSARDALIEYATLRDRQRRHGAVAARACLQAVIEEGDDATLAAAVDAVRAVAYADADLSER
jgi:hypothetical protein